MFFKKIDERIKVLFLIILLLFIFIIIRVFYIQVIDYKKLNKYAKDLWSRDLPIEADRGLILDRNGVVLADNLTTTSLILIPNQIKNKEETTSLLANILNVKYEEMKEPVYKKTSIERVHPDALSIEKLFFNTNTTTAIDVAQARGVILLAAKKHNIPVYEYTPLQVKSAVTGYGRAEKKQVMDMVKNLLRLEKIPKPDDTADALAIAVCHAHSAGSLYSKLNSGGSI